MSAKYALFENPDPMKEGSEKRFHARLVAQGVVRTEEIIQYISDASSFSSGDVKGLLDTLSQAIGMYLERGYTVDIDELGTFSISLKCDPIENPKKVNAHAVHFRNVHYKADKKLMKRLQGMRFERAEEAPVTLYTQEQRRSKALNYLKKHEYMTRSDYMRMSGCSRATACNDIRELLDGGVIRKLGAGRAIIYVKA